MGNYAQQGSPSPVFAGGDKATTSRMRYVHISAYTAEPFPWLAPTCGDYDVITRGIHHKIFQRITKVSKNR